jgi:hypothetical protein
MSGHEPEDELAEADVTEDEFDQRMAKARPARLVEPPRISWGTTDAGLAVTLLRLGALQLSESGFSAPGVLPLEPSAVKS